MSEPPLSDAQRDALIRTLTKQCSDRDRELYDAALVIDELRAALVAAHEENNRLRAGLVPETPFAA